jgi:hypothetical protein
VLELVTYLPFSSALVSATNKVYQSLAKLIKLCDDVLLQGEKALDKENVAEVIQLLEDAVQVTMIAAAAAAAAADHPAMTYVFTLSSLSESCLVGSRSDCKPRE